MPFVSVDNGKDTYPFEVSTESGSFSTLSKDVSEHFELGAEFKLKTKNGNFTVSSDRTLSAALSYKSEGDELRLTLEVPNNTAPPLAPAPLTQSNPPANGGSPDPNASGLDGAAPAGAEQAAPEHAPDADADADADAGVALIELSDAAANLKIPPGGESQLLEADQQLQVAEQLQERGGQAAVNAGFGYTPAQNATAIVYATPAGLSAKAAGKRKASNSPGSAKKHVRELTPKEQGQKMAKLKEDHANEWGKLDAGKDATIAFGQYSMMNEGNPIKTSGDGNYAKYVRYLRTMFDARIYVKMADVLSEDALGKFNAWADEKNMEPIPRKNHRCGLNKFISLLREAKKQGLLY